MRLFLTLYCLILLCQVATSGRQQDTLYSPSNIPVADSLKIEILADSAARRAAKKLDTLLSKPKPLKIDIIGYKQHVWFYRIYNGDTLYRYKKIYPIWKNL